MSSKEGSWLVAIVLLAIGMAGSAASAEESEWTGEVAASLTAQTGTTDSIAGSVDAKAVRSDDVDVYTARLSALYGTTRSRNQASNDETTQNSQGLFGGWKRIIHERFFWDTTGELSRDTVQDRAVRVAFDTGPGYRFWQGEDVKKKHFDVSAGLGYRFEIYDLTTAPGDAQRGQYDDDQFVDVVVGFEYKNLLFDDKIEYTHTGSAKMPANDPASYLLRTEVILGVPLTEAWSFRAAFLAEYVAEQPDEINNTTTRSTLGLGYKF